MASDNAAPRIKLSGKRLVGFDTGIRQPAEERAGSAEGTAVTKIGAVKLGAPKQGLRKPDC